ncbi:MAG: hypothetical protein A2Z32_10225 [Chloroflexi bacterium RBG_16_69_14]|nr:MAG: hypothetical protein A2Z32_10225 [Chloroflexi bacterium RBG_16_69_14]
MNFMRWDEESRLRVVVSLVALAVGAYGFATTEPTYYLHLPAVVLVVFAVWGLLLAVVPDLRGKRGTPHRVLIVAASWAVVLLIIVILGRAAVSP